jgi:hypothetical protein
MKTLLLALLVVMSLLPGQALAGAIGEAEKPVVAAAKAWLALVDAGDSAQSWQQASAFFRGAVAERQWATALAGLRTPLGAPASRTETSARHVTSLPGVPDGQYVVMTFDTAFANKKTAIETVTFRQDTDGTWRAAGYFVQ